MSNPVQLPKLATAPHEYDAEMFQQILKAIDKSLNLLNSSGAVRATRITLTDLPTSASGLETGTLWNDAGTVKVA